MTTTPRQASRWACTCSGSWRRSRRADWLHRRRTGTSGYLGSSGAPGSAQWWAGCCSRPRSCSAPPDRHLAVAGTGPQPAAPPAALRWAGLAAAVLGFAAVLGAQSAMGSSWRIGVDPGERTSLVTTGAFALVRNPIFTAMITALTGVALLAPTLVTAAALVSLVLAVELQVRVVEEPYLRQVHGQQYALYTARVGRFVPGIGLQRQVLATEGENAR
ncbi:MAG: isoprenylcysteine carboxylmethyltransferase family protein [Cellulomonas sp.]|uniref:methyltransferase family protein n=1 Tax=Cellulomonas sp. TaxID=40001 RepID=UPI00258D3910|nr:isoprenylcysteine carboxylmethyltransferase family protein [Cellulomonas sp.]MCR6704753.1 isoprenylcysteine carboxylmethyltransferase family protein [Cellulomonas sp.]